MLYAARRPCPLRDGPYLSIDDRAFCESALTGICVGGLTVDVSAGQSRPAVVFARLLEAERRAELVVHVYDAPLAAMEAELFSGVGASSTFERSWLAEKATFDRKQRARLGQYIRTRGMDEMPTWLHGNKYALERPGALVLLRARTPSTDAERDELRAALERETKPEGGVHSLKDVMQHFAPAGMRVSIRTVFFPRPLSDKPEREPADDGVEGCIEALDFSVIGPLALIVLKHLETEDFYGVDAGEASAHAWQAPDADDDGKDVEEMEALDCALSRTDASADECAPPEVVGPGGQQPAAVTVANTPMKILASTLRPCDVKLVVHTDVPIDAARAVVRAFVSAEDIPKANAVLQFHTHASIRLAIGGIASALTDRHAILLIEKTEDGRVQTCSLFSAKGHWNVPVEAIARYVLFPWVTPLILDGMVLNEIQVHAVVREALHLSATPLPAAAAVSEPPDPQAPQAPPAAEAVVNATTVLTASSLSNVAELAAILSEVRNVATALKEAVATSRTDTRTDTGTDTGTERNEHVQRVERVDAVDSPLTRSLKRTIAYLEAC